MEKLQEVPTSGSGWVYDNSVRKAKTEIPGNYSKREDKMDIPVNPPNPMVPDW